MYSRLKLLQLKKLYHGSLKFHHAVWDLVMVWSSFLFCIFQKQNPISCSCYYQSATHHTSTAQLHTQDKGKRNRKTDKKGWSACPQRNQRLNEKRAEKHVCIHNQPLSPKLKWPLNTELTPVWIRAAYSSYQLARGESSIHKSYVVFPSIVVFVNTSWKWFVSSLQPWWFGRAPSLAGKISSCLPLNVDGPRQGFNWRFLLKKLPLSTVWQHESMIRPLFISCCHFV